MIVVQFVALLAASAGWWPPLLTVLLGAAIVVLFLSMRKQMRKIDIPDDVGQADQPTDTRH